MVEMKSEYEIKNRIGVDSCTKLFLRGHWIHGVIVQSIKASE